MHVALLANTAWLDEQLSCFHDLVVGLIDEQIRVVQVVPVQLAEEESRAFGERVNWDDSRWSVVRRWRLARLSTALQSLDITLLHALDGRLWEGTMGLARRLNCTAVFSASSSLDINQAARVARNLDPAAIAFTAATTPLATALRQHLDPQIAVDFIPTAVHVSNEQSRRSSVRDGKPMCGVISGDGQFDSGYEALFGALNVILAQDPNAQFFLDGMGSDQQQIWQCAKRYKLLANMSLVPRRLGHRELLLHADFLIQPQSLGRTRSLTLHAMAHGIPVLAMQDPWLDYLIEGQTAWLVEQRDTDQWAKLLCRYISDPQAAQNLGLEARQWVRENRLAAMEVDHTLQLYRRICGEALKFQN